MVGKKKLHYLKLVIFKVIGRFVKSLFSQTQKEEQIEPTQPNVYFMISLLISHTITCLSQFSFFLSAKLFPLIENIWHNDLAPFIRLV